MTAKGGLVSNRPFVTPHFAENVQGNCLFSTSEQARWESEKKQVAPVQIVIIGGRGRNVQETETRGRASNAPQGSFGPDVG